MLKDTDQILLSGNNLGSFKKAPNYLESIVLLNLSSSNIREIDEMAIEVIIKTVKTLDVRHNKLTTIPQSISKANKTNRLWMSDNPYDCNCDMLWMKDWLLDTDVVLDKINVTCSGSDVKGETVVFWS